MSDRPYMLDNGRTDIATISDKGVLHVDADKLLELPEVQQQLTASMMLAAQRGLPKE